MTTVEFKDHSAECKEEIESRALKALTLSLIHISEPTRPY